VCANPFCSHIQTLCAESPVAFGVGAALQTLFSALVSPPILGAYSEMQQGHYWCALDARKLLRPFLSLFEKF
jgi:hypothetical protein